ncbi:MAG: malonyl-CoA decarboxylase family protein [Acidimicrobiales bacterium]|nr:malonyl-CoA decarboxylase family protein [Acidimicrobiales bacterium]
MALRRVRATARAGFEEATARWRRRPRPGNALNDRDLTRLRERIEACLDPRLSGVAIRNRAGEVADVVVALDRTGLDAFFTLLLESFGPRLDAVQRALDDTADVLAPIRGDRADPAGAMAAVAALREACAPRWEQLFELLCGLTGGVKLAVDLRAELLALLREHPELAPLDRDLQQVLSRLFPPGLLELRRITWNSPGSLLEKLIDYEAVHEITSWEDLKNRLDDHDRRCYAFIHPGMPDEPLIFVEVALLDAIAGDVVRLLDVSAPSGIGHEATTAIFYSISACQPGLAGVNLGDVLIKEVVADLTRDLPRLNQFATLSPLPGFRRWLDAELAKPDTTVLSAEDLETIAELTPDGATGPAALSALLAGGLTDTGPQHKALRELLIGLCVDYLLGDEPGRSRDRVANFHLTNGAQVERLNWMANATPAGLRESYGLMVNYRYDLSKIDAHHEQYVAHGHIARSSSIARIATARRKARAARAENH